MKKMSRVFVLVLAIFALLISACGAPVSAPAVNLSGGGSKPKASPVEFTGVIEAINGNQWTIAGQTFIVDPAVVRDGPFSVGDTVKLEIEVQQDGSTIVSRVELPLNAPNTNEDNGNSANANADDSGFANANDNDSGFVNANDNDSGFVNANDNSNSSVSVNDNSDDGSGSNDNGRGGGNSNDDDKRDDNDSDDADDDD